MYGKVFSSLWHGSLLGNPDAQLVFVMLIAHANQSGDVEAHPAEMATWTGLDRERIEVALATLMEADPDSRSPEEDGKRLVRNGLTEWHIVNYKRYRAMRDEESRQEQNRRSQAKRRVSQASATVSRESATVSHRQPPSAQEEVEVEVEVEEKKKHSPRLRRVERECEGFAEFYEAYPRKEDRLDANKAFSAALKRHRHITAEEMAWAAGEYATDMRKEGREEKHVKYPGPWLRAGGYLKYLVDEEVSDGEAQDGSAERRAAQAGGPAAAVLGRVPE